MSEKIHSDANLEIDVNIASSKGQVDIPPSKLEVEISVSGGGGSGGLSELPVASTARLGGVKVGPNLLIDQSGVLSVDTADDAEQDNTRPITAAAVHTQLGNIEILLKTI